MSILSQLQPRSRGSPLGLAIATAMAVAVSGCSKRQEIVRTEPAPAISIPFESAPPASAPPPLVTAAPPLASAKPRFRDSATVTIDGVAETWRLEWRAPPKLACVDEHWWTCPCKGFAFGEEGELDLVRERDGGGEIERLDLASAFAETGGVATLQAWEPTKAEYDRDMLTDSGAHPSAAELEARPRVKILVLRDYDHDGVASEFVLQIGTQPCFRTHSVVVGVSRTNRQLHVFRDSDHPESPIVFPYKQDWETVRTKRSARLVEVGCGDHGSDEEVTAFVRTDARGLHVTRQTKRCPP